MKACGEKVFGMRALPQFPNFLGKVRGLDEAEGFPYVPGVSRPRAIEKHAAVGDPFRKTLIKPGAQPLFDAVFENVGNDHRPEKIHRERPVGALPGEGDDGRKEHGDCSCHTVKRMKEHRLPAFGLGFDE